eukprot:322958_1
MRYESVSGSIVNGICNINSIVGDCCQGNGECIMGSCTAPTAAPTAAPSDAPSNAPSNTPTLNPTNAPTLNPTSQTNNPTLSPTDSDDDSGSSSDDDSGDDASFNARMKNKHGKYDIYNINNNTMIRYEEIIDMDVNLSESTWINIWGISGVIVIINVVLICIYYYKRKKIIQTLPLYR